MDLANVPIGAACEPRQDLTQGAGRDFSDVTPLRGEVLGTAKQSLTVAVSLEPG